MGRTHNWIDYDYDPYCPQCDQNPCECSIDVCQNCGGYFTWTAELTEVWRKHWGGRPSDIQPQRCRRCLIDECWIEDIRP